MRIDKQTSPLTTFTLCRPWQGQAEYIWGADDVVSSNLRSDKPTRHIVIPNNQVFSILFKSLLKELELLGEINNTFPFFSTDLTIVSYFKIQDAQSAVKFINNKYFNTFEASFVKPCILKKPHDHRILVILLISNDIKTDYMEQLLKFGNIYSFSEAIVSHDKKIINIEFDDERVSQKIISELNNKNLNGIKYKVYKCDNDKISCTCHKPKPDIKDNVIRRPFRNLSQKTLLEQKSSLNQKTSALNKIEPFSYFSVDPFSSESDSSSFTTKTVSENSTSPTKSEPIDITSIKGKKSNELDLKKIISGKDNRTTFMIRNIPNKYTQKMLIDCINKTHANTYDFLYLRMDFKNKCNVGYAFINFISVQSVISFAKARVGKKWEFFNSEKKCSLSYAEIQSKEALVRKFRSSHVMEEDEAFRPKLFYTSGLNKGQEQPFPKGKARSHSRRRHHKKIDSRN